MAKVTIDVRCTRQLADIVTLPGTITDVTRANCMHIMDGMIMHNPLTRADVCAMCNRDLDNTGMLYIAKAAHVWLMPDGETVSKLVGWAARTCANDTGPCFDTAMEWADSEYNSMQTAIEAAGGH